MKVVRAATAGFCMGVSLALQKLDDALDASGNGDSGGRIATLGALIHNPQVLADYAGRGVVCIGEDDALFPEDCVVIRAHGITRQREARLRECGVRVVDATCPRVKKAQLSIARATSRGATLLLFGEGQHPEVRGLVSYATGAAHVFASPDELLGLDLSPDADVVLASQTTQDKAIFDVLVMDLKKRFPSLTVLSTICDATKERQDEARRIAQSVDVMVVMGGRQSGNTRRLADVAAAGGIETFHVETVEELDAGSFLQKRVAGLTAGASTPKRLIDIAERWLSAL